MALRYREWPPMNPALRGFITAFWEVDGDASDVANPLILPDDHVELVMNVGEPVWLSGPVSHGAQPARAVVGLLSYSVRMSYTGSVHTLGVRLHAGSASACLDCDASAFRDAIRPLDEVATALDAALASVTTADWDMSRADSRAELEGVMARHLAASHRVADAAVVAAVDQLTTRVPMPTVQEIARDLAVSPRHLQRRFQAAVGVSPKQFARATRFARLWQRVTQAPPDAWAGFAMEFGYADQAHMIREFRSFGAEPPAHFFDSRWYETTSFSRTPPAPSKVQE